MFQMMNNDGTWEDVEFDRVVTVFKRFFGGNFEAVISFMYDNPDTVQGTGVSAYRWHV